MAAVTERQILDALGRVRDPDKGGDIVSLNMVSGIVIRDGNVGFAIEVEPERGPRLEPLRKAAAVRPAMRLDIEFADGHIGATADGALLSGAERPGSAVHAVSGPRKPRSRRGEIPGQGSLF